MLRTTDAASIMDVNLDLTNPSTGTPLMPDGSPDASLAIGQDYQLVDSAGQQACYLLADRAIGTIRSGGTIGEIGDEILAPYFIVNADHRGSDGTIDLIDDAGDFGTAGAGGPHILTGPGGNVRYIRVAGAVFKSEFYGGGSDNPSILAPGQTMRLTDDSGTSFKLSPFPNVPDTTNGGSTFLNPGNLSVLTYAVDDQKSGVVVLNVTVDNASTDGVANHGLLVQSGAAGTNGSVEFGEIQLDDIGADCRNPVRQWRPTRHLRAANRHDGPDYHRHAQHRYARRCNARRPQHDRCL